MCDNNWLGNSCSGDQGMEGSVTGLVPVTFSFNVSTGNAIMSNNDGMDSGCGCRRRRNSCGCGCRRSRCCW